MDSTDQSLDFDWKAPNAIGPLFIENLRKIQARTPVFWSDSQHAWLITRFQDCVDGLRDERFSNHRMHLLIDFDQSGRVYKLYPEFSEAILKWIFNLDGLPHQRLRKLLMPHFTKSQAAKYRDFAAATMTELLDQMEGRDSIEFLHEISLPYTCRTLLHMLGLEGIVSENQLLAWGESISYAFGTSYLGPDACAPAEEAVLGITEVLLKEIAKRRTTPGDDLLSQILQPAEDGDRLADAEIIALFHVLLLGGFDTTAHTLYHILVALEALPDRVDYLRAHPDEMSEIIDELQRHVGLIGVMTRVVKDDMVWHDRKMKKGDLVYFMLCAANRDEKQFPHPETIDFGRRRGLNMVFGPGLHHCLGHNVAKMELDAALTTIYNRYDRVEILDKPLQWTPNSLTRSLAQLHVRFHRRLPQ